MTAARTIRDLIAAPGMVVAPGAFECIGARFIEQAGYPLIYMSGAGTAATLGYPDYGLTTLTEMAANAGRIARAVDVPVIADADTGFGNELNTVRCVQEYERAGVAGLHIEDQGFPKRCGHLADKQVIEREPFLSKIAAAASARRSPDFWLIARTDARASHGLAEAITRANLALEAGADMAFVEAPQTIEELATVPREVAGPCLINNVWKGRTPDLPFDQAQDMGYRIMILPSLLLKSFMATCDRMLADTRAGGRHADPGTEITPQGGFARLGGPEWDAVSARFSTDKGR